MIEMPAQHQLLQRLAHLTLANPSNLCFANATVLSMMWSTLSTNTWTETYWGTQCRELLILLHGQDCATLTDQAWFQQIMRCWGERDPLFDPGNIMQQDAAEFVATWFSILQSTAFDIRWEKRLESHQMVQILDTGSMYSPICLKFDATLAQLPICDLTQLWQVWNDVDGMRTGMTTAPPCLCVQVDRCIMDGLNQVSKCECKIQTDDPCLVPVFSADTLQCVKVEYHVQAVTAHLGADQAGHIRAALRLAPSIVQEIHPANWLLTEDWQQPTAVWDIPNWMKRNSTMFWLVRSDLLQLWRFRPHHVETADLAMRDQILAMLPLPAETP